jgi:hypothetical protein
MLDLIALWICRKSDGFHLAADAEWSLVADSPQAIQAKKRGGAEAAKMCNANLSRSATLASVYCREDEPEADAAVMIVTRYLVTLRDGAVDDCENSRVWSCSKRVRAAVRAFHLDEVMVTAGYSTGAQVELPTDGVAIPRMSSPHRIRGIATPSVG